MAERVFLHVGLPKSGTSYLQSVLWANRDRLIADGYLLPGTRAAHYRAMCDLRGGLWHDPAAQGQWTRLVERIRRHRGSAVISEEMLGAATREQAEAAVEALAGAEVHVVVAVRDLGRSIPSAWQQAVRARGRSGFTDYVAALRDGANPGFWATQTPVPVLRRWTSLVPSTQRHVVVVPGQDAPRDELWKRFARAVDLDADRYEIGSPPGNPSLGAAEAELLRRVNVALGDAFPLNRPYGQVVRAHLTAPVLLANPTPARFAVDARDAPWVELRSSDLVRELAAFPCQVVGPLADLRPPAPSDTRSPDDLSAEELLDMAIGSMVAMLEHTDQRLGSWRRTVAAGRRREADLRAELRRARHRRGTGLGRVQRLWSAATVGTGGRR